MQSICTVVFVDSIKVRPTGDVLLEGTQNTAHKKIPDRVSQMRRAHYRDSDGGVA